MTEILRTRNGKLSELVETERSVAQAQEELDQAKAWLAELQGRVALSDFDIRYEAVSIAPSGNLASALAESASGSLGMFLAGVRALLTLLIFLAPWAGVGLAGWWVVRTIRRRQIAPSA
jgi:hypothetical protein